MKTQQTPFRPYNPDQLLLLPPDMTHWLPQEHLVYFIQDLVGQMDLLGHIDFLQSFWISIYHEFLYL
jgi:hypothetical protein